MVAALHPCYLLFYAAERARKVWKRDGPVQTPPGPAPGAPPQQLDYLALQEIHHAGDAFHAFGASGQLTSSDGITFVPYDGAHVPDAAFGSMLLSVRPSPLLPPPTSKSAFMSIDGGASWSPLPLQADVTSADCKVQYCIATSEGLLAYDPGR